MYQVFGIGLALGAAWLLEACGPTQKPSPKSEPESLESPPRSSGEMLRALGLKPETAKVTTYSEHVPDAVQQKIVIVEEKKAKSGLAVAFSVPNANAPVDSIEGMAFHLAVDPQTGAALVAGTKHHLIAMAIDKDGNVRTLNLDEHKMPVRVDGKPVAPTLFTKDKSNTSWTTLNYVFHDPREFSQSGGGNSK